MSRELALCSQSERVGLYVLSSESRRSKLSKEFSSRDKKSMAVIDFSLNAMKE